MGRDEDQFFAGLIAERIQWVSPIDPDTNSLDAWTHIRYRHRGVNSKITFMPQERGNVIVHFDTPQKAVAPGQAAVFYQEDAVIGGGWISKGVRRD